MLFLNKVTSSYLSSVSLLEALPTGLDDCIPLERYLRLQLDIYSTALFINLGRRYASMGSCSPLVQAMEENTLHKTKLEQDLLDLYPIVHAGMTRKWELADASTANLILALILNIDPSVGKRFEKFISTPTLTAVLFDLQDPKQTFLALRNQAKQSVSPKQAILFSNLILDLIDSHKSGFLRSQVSKILIEFLAQSPHLIHPPTETTPAQSWYLRLLDVLPQYPQDIQISAPYACVYLFVYAQANTAGCAVQPHHTDHLTGTEALLMLDPVSRALFCSSVRGKQPSSGEGTKTSPAVSITLNGRPLTKGKVVKVAGDNNCAYTACCLIIDDLPDTQRPTCFGHKPLTVPRLREIVASHLLAHPDRYRSDIEAELIDIFCEIARRCRDPQCQDPAALIPLLMIQRPHLCAAIRPHIHLFLDGTFPTVREFIEYFQLLEIPLSGPFSKDYQVDGVSLDPGPHLEIMRAHMKLLPDTHQDIRQCTHWGDRLTFAVLDDLGVPVAIYCNNPTSSTLEATAYGTAAPDNTDFALAQLYSRGAVVLDVLGYHYDRLLLQRGPILVEILKGVLSGEFDRDLVISSLLSQPACIFQIPSIKVALNTFHADLKRSSDPSPFIRLLRDCQLEGLLNP